ncbi:MAG: hypothetical protein RLZZ374_1960 [Cyanobacteriota bacterium]|jgi:hypothetical protein
MALRSSLRALPLALVALFSSPLAVIAQTGGPPQGDDPGRSERPNPPQGPSKEAREAMLKREAAAMAKLSLAQRKAYIQARQDMQRQLFEKRLVDLKRFGQCYEQAITLAAIQACQQLERTSWKQDRRQTMEQVLKIRQRFGFPALTPPRGRGAEAAGKPQYKNQDGPPAGAF